MLMSSKILFVMFVQLVRKNGLDMCRMVGSWFMDMWDWSADDELQSCSHSLHLNWLGVSTDCTFFLCFMVTWRFKTMLVLAVYSHESHLISFSFVISLVLISFADLTTSYSIVSLSIFCDILLISDSNWLTLLVS